MPIPSHASVPERLRNELKRLKREGRTKLELSVTNSYPHIDQPVDLAVRLQQFDPLCIWLPVQFERVAIWRNDGSGASTKMDVITEPNGGATVKELYSDAADLTYYAEYTPPSNRPLMGSHSNSVTIKARIGTTLTLEWPAKDRVCEDLRCCGPLRALLSDQYHNGVEGKEITFTAHWCDSKGDSGTTQILKLQSDSSGFISQTWTHYQLTGDYERWYDRIRAEFAGDDVYHATDSGWALATRKVRTF